MHPLFITTLWQFLLVIAGTSTFSLLVLGIGLYIQAGRRDERKNLEAKAEATGERSAKTPGIMGTARQPKRQSTPIEADERQNENPEEKQATFAREIPSAELNQVFGAEETDEINLGEDPDPDEDQVDWQDEETELQAHRTVTDDTDFATGVSFGELQQATRLIQKEELQPDEQKSVIDTAAKLAHTDMWEKVMNALPDAYEKITKMLDPSPQKVPAAEDWKSFDIRNFI